MEEMRYSSGMNTPGSGTYRWMVYKDGDSWVGVAFEFNIVVTGDDPRVVEVELQEAVIGYLESAKKLQKGFRPNQLHSMLNQEADDEYEAIWKRASLPANSGEKGVPSPLSDIYKVGIANLANV